MDDQFYFRNVPAISFPFIELPQAQLDFLLSNTRLILERLERAKKGAVVLDHFQSRLRERQVVRCTPQSVKVTAAARYAPHQNDLNLSSITTSLFVHLITYLPLPEIRILAGNHEALHEASKMSAKGDIDQRWGTYYTCLGTVNNEWAQLFFNEIHKQLASSNESTDHYTGTRLDDRAENNRITAEPTGPIAHHDGPNVTLELSDIAARQQPDESTDHDMVAATTGMQDPTPPTDDAWQQNICSALDNTDIHEFQKEETMYIRVLRAKENAWGPDHPTTLDTVRQLGEFYAAHGRMRDAQAMYLKILQASQGQTDNVHPES